MIGGGNKGNFANIHRFTVLLSFVGLLFLGSSIESQAKSLAFSVGVNSYENLAAYRQLQNAENDADGIAKKFKELEYTKVHRLLNPSRSRFYERWDDFLEQIEGGDTVVFFFSGHGIQIEGTDYLLPSDIPLIRYTASPSAIESFGIPKARFL